MRILIPIDKSDNSVRAFDWYLAQLHREGDSLILVHYIEAGNDRELYEKEAKLMELQESYETKLLEHKVDYRWITGTDGGPSELIVRISREEDAAMILMGSRGLGKIRKVIQTSVSDDVLAKSSVPVLICKGS
jgi:nucleotide-binding universal stress UspA family protein